jgi:RNA polymerase sigma-70 factor (ECF subfamily)
MVVAAQQGDEEAFRSLYRAVQPSLLRYLRTLVGDDAEDVASETWLQIARDLASFGGTSGFRAWAATIARNRALDHVRLMRRRPAVPTPIEHLVQLPNGQDTGELAAELMSTDVAISLIAALPPDQAEAVLLRVVVGLDAKSAAEVLGKQAGAVRTAAYRGLRRLAQRLDELGVTSEQVARSLPRPRTEMHRQVQKTVDNGGSPQPDRGDSGPDEPRHVEPASAGPAGT